MTMEFDITALEMLPADEADGLLPCTITCKVTCVETCTVTE
jgi:hypothetical protein